MDWSSAIFWLNVIGVIVLVVLYAWRWIFPTPAPEEPKIHIGDITAETLRYYCGYDYMRPILVAVK